jgi:hypothetical protein
MLRDDASEAAGRCGDLLATGTGMKAPSGARQIDSLPAT